MLFLLTILILSLLLIFFIRKTFKTTHFPRKGKIIEPTKPRLCQPKPKWVKNEVINLSAHLPHYSCRKLAYLFNHLHITKHNMSVGKTFVYETIRDNKYEVQQLRKKWKNRIPKTVPINLTWALDLTGKQTNKKTNNILGLIDHGSRKLLQLQVLKNKTSLQIVKCLIQAIELYGTPKNLRTDNEIVFNSVLFRSILIIFGIKHQKSEKCCPWQNGRIERLFGTLKEKLNYWKVDSPQQLQKSIVHFKYWYNNIRPHQHLDGRTPNEAWNNIDPYSRTPKSIKFYSQWNGLIQGYDIKYE